MNTAIIKNIIEDKENLENNKSYILLEDEGVFAKNLGLGATLKVYENGFDLNLTIVGGNPWNSNLSIKKYFEMYESNIKKYIDNYEKAHVEFDVQEIRTEIRLKVKIEVLEFSYTEFLKSFVEFSNSFEDKVERLNNMIDSFIEDNIDKVF